MSKFSLAIIRGLLGGLITIEVLALLGWLPLQGEYNWYIGMVVTATSVWVLNEIYIWFAQRHIGITVPFFAPFFAVGAVYFDAFGDIMHWYGIYDWYDQIVHTTGGLAASCAFYFFFTAWSKYKGYKIPYWFRLWIGVTSTAAAGTLYEIEEYLEDYFGHTSFRLGNGPDTANDLLCNLSGALLATVLVTTYRYWQSRKT